MFIKKKESLEAQDEQRQRIIAFKKTFASPEGKTVLYDLMNRFHVLNPINEKTDREDWKAEGRRQVVLFILSQSNISIESFDAILKGDDHDRFDSRI